MGGTNNLTINISPILPSNSTSASGQFISSNFHSSFGYGLVNATGAIRSLTGQNVLEVNDTNRWEVEMINAPEAWSVGLTGQGVVVVAVVDDGVDYNHFDLDSNIWANPGEVVNGIDDDGNGFIDDIRGWDFIGNDNNPFEAGLTHGTRVAGVVAAESANNGGIVMTGGAYNAKIMPVRVMSSIGGSDQNIGQGIRYAANKGAKVINLSLGRYTDPSDPTSQMTSAIDYAVGKGSVVVISAGNDGNVTIDSRFPAILANRPGVIAVGSVNQNLQLSTFSSRAGTTIRNYVVAPGENYFTTLPGNTYGNANGTSFSAPSVSSVVAATIQAAPWATPSQIVSAVINSANPAGIVS
jgi:subtilisin family serine protease